MDAIYEPRCLIQVQRLLDCSPILGAEYNEILAVAALNP